jgi:MoaA/NifB/PqqE/SkfB family radical SAM enzyme
MAPPSPGRNIEINIGKLCNNACVFCANGCIPRAERRWVPEATVRAEIARAARQGFRSLGFLGGEITSHPHAERLVAEARRLGFTRIALCTNGRRFADRALLERFLAAGTTRVALSIHSHQAAIEDRLNARPGAFAQQLSAIDNLVAAADAGALPDGFSLNTCIHGLNVHELHGLVRFFHRRGVRDIRLNVLRPEHHAVGSRELVPPLAEVAAEARRVIDLNERRLHMTLTFGDVPLCVWPPALLNHPARAAAYIGELRDYDTDVTVFRGDGPGGDPDRFHWKTRRTADLKAHVAACARCAARDRCEGPWLRYCEMHGEGEFRALERVAGRWRFARAVPTRHAARRSRLHVMVANGCNNRCLFCLEDRAQRARADFSDQHRALELYARRDAVLFTCGEPTLDERLVPWVRRAAELGYRDIELVTNGRRLAYRAFAERLVGAGLTAVTLSLHGDSARVHDPLTATKGSFEQSAAGLRNLVALRRTLGRPFVTTSTVLTKRNLAQAARIVRFLAAEGAERMVLNYVEPEHEALRRFELVVPRMAEAARVLGALRPLPGVELKVEGLPACLLREQPRLCGDREVIYIYAGGRLRRLSPTRRQLKGPPCRSCAARGRCDGVWLEYARRFGWDEFRPLGEASR